MHHAVVTARVVAAAIILPRGLGHEFFERPVVAVRDQVARALPALRVVVRSPPRRALEVALTLEEGENILRFSRNKPPQYGLAIKNFTLTPLK